MFKCSAKYFATLLQGLVGRNFNVTYALLGTDADGYHFSLDFSLKLPMPR